MNKGHYLLISPVSTDESISMRLYAVGVQQILERHGNKVDRLYVRNISYPKMVSKFFEILVRYVYYPICIVTSKATVVHVIDHTYSFLIPVVKAVRKRCIVSVHNNLDDILSPSLWLRHSERSLLPVLSKFLFHFSLRQVLFADHCICVAKHIQKSLESRGVSSNKITVIPAPISEVFFTEYSPSQKQKIRTFIKQKGNQFYVLHVGNTDPAHKNIEHILRCVAYLKRAGWRVFFFKIGEKFSEKQLELISANECQDRVIHLGELPQASIKLLFAVSDVLLFPSYYEGCPAAPLEALSCGLPVIASNIQAHEEYLNGSAFMVPIEQHTISAAHIMKLISNKHIASKLIRKGRGMARRMRWQHISNPVLFVYQTQQDEYCRSR